ncbi:hypothetical protein MLD38_004425 [Melastoma candidum]|uniref:Uncharacterized protein n=1 Tax=Melastoma candidum TaxID=119954 RepID=A0ACB9S8X1_9MYRT|nr:hypothetical protein MLD38_004425 [Melastoma candidum]
MEKAAAVIKTISSSTIFPEPTKPQPFFPLGAGHDGASGPVDRPALLSQRNGDLTLKAEPGPSRLNQDLHPLFSLASHPTAKSSRHHNPPASDPHQSQLIQLPTELQARIQTLTVDSGNARMQSQTRPTSTRPGPSQVHAA